MYKTICLFLIIFVATACEEKNDSPFLYILDNAAQIVEMNVETGASGNLVFTPVIYASQMVVNWGDGSRFMEYVNPDSASRKALPLNPLKYAYPAADTYTVSFRAVKVTKLDISIDSVGQSVTELSLTNCRHLKTLSNSGQILRTVDIATSGLKTVDFRNLSMMENLSILKCDSLSDILLSNNAALSTVSLSDNRSLTASALNAMFGQLPETTSGKRTVILSNNAGDAACDTTIATRKGWSVRVE